MNNRSSPHIRTRKLIADERTTAIMQAIGKKIRERMKFLGVERHELAKMLGISGPRVYSMIKGGNISLLTLLKLQEKLDMEIIKID